MSPERIALRLVDAGDEEFLFAVYASTRESEMALVPWSPEQKKAFVRMQFAAQKQHYAAEHPRADHHVIYRDGIPVGRIYVDRTGENFQVLDITVLPQHRKGGAGTHVLRQLMDEAAAAGKAVTIYVESFNPSLALFHALGFQKVADREFHWLLSWSRTD